MDGRVLACTCCDAGEDTLQTPGESARMVVLESGHSQVLCMGCAMMLDASREVM